MTAPDAGKTPALDASAVCGPVRQETIRCTFCARPTVHDLYWIYKGQGGGGYQAMQKCSECQEARTR